MVCKQDRKTSHMLRSESHLNFIDRTYWVGRWNPKLPHIPPRTTCCPQLSLSET